MRKGLLFLFLTLTCVMVHAVPAKPGIWQILTLTDGSTVEAELMGDEHTKFYKAADGTCYVADSNGETFHAVSMAVLQMQRDEAMKSLAPQRMKSRSAQWGANGMATEGDPSKRALVILVQFADSKFAEGHDLELYQKIFNETNYTEHGFYGSVYDYFRKQSDYKLNPQFDVVGPFTLSGNYATYGADGSNANDKYINKFVREACEAADATVDFSQYDADNDGKVDQLIFIYAGLGQNNGGDSNTIWPHEWTYAEACWKVFDLTGIMKKFDGKSLDTYACSSELQPTRYGTVNGKRVVTATRLDGIGVICHEYSHCLGLPDLYDTSGSNLGMGHWSIMANGCYNNSGYRPCGYTSYERMSLGWITPIVLDKDPVAVTDMQPVINGGNTYILYNDNNHNEYFLIENRQKTSWDAYLPGKGLLILHVDYDKSAWNNNKINTDANHQRCTIMPADNLLSKSNEGNDAFPYGSLNSFDNNSKPAAYLYNANSDGSMFLNKGISDITQYDDGTMSFNYKTSSIDFKGEAGTVFLETFSACCGDGGNDNKWSGNICKGIMRPDMSGWTYEDTTSHGGNQCALFGNEDTAVEPVSPAFTINGETKLRFKAAPWDQETVTLYLSVSEGTAEFTGEELFTLEPGKWTTCETTLKGTGDIKISFSPEGKRFFLDDINAYGTTTGIESIEADKELPDDHRIYTLDGRYVGTDMQSLPRGAYIQGGKKVIK